MEKESILAQPSTTGRVKYIRLTLDGAVLSREWGLIDGATQTSDNTFEGKNLGKKNEKSPEQVAEEAFQSLIARKEKNGYKQFPSLEAARGSKSDVMDIDNPPASFTAGKPKNTDLREPQHDIDQLFNEGRALVQVKENGIGHYFVIDSSGEPRIYTRKFADHSRKYPSIIDALKNGIEMSLIPCSSMFMIELVCPDSFALNKLTHMDRFIRTQNIHKADVLNGELLPDQSESHRRIKEFGIQAVVYNFIYKNGSFIGNVPYGERYAGIRYIFEENFGPLIIPAKEIYPQSLAELKNLLAILKEHIEGAVIWDLEGKTEITFNGTPKRTGSWKAKLHDPTDVVAWSWEAGNGSRQGKIGALRIGLYKSNGEFMDLGGVGSGLNDETSEINYWAGKLPCVICIEHNGRFDTGKFQFPRYIGKHPDKTPGECTLEEKYDK